MKHSVQCACHHMLGQVVGLNHGIVCLLNQMAGEIGLLSKIIVHEILSPNVHIKHSNNKKTRYMLWHENQSKQVFCNWNIVTMKLHFRFPKIYLYYTFQFVWLNTDSTKVQKSIPQCIVFWNPPEYLVNDSMTGYFWKFLCETALWIFSFSAVNVWWFCLSS